MKKSNKALDLKKTPEYLAYTTLKRAIRQADLACIAAENAMQEVREADWNDDSSDRLHEALLDSRRFVEQCEENCAAMREHREVAYAHAIKTFKKAAFDAGGNNE